MDNSWLINKLKEMRGGLLENRFGASIDVEISVEKCACRNVFMSMFRDKYYWDSIKKETYSYVVLRDSVEIIEKKSGEHYLLTDIMPPSRISGADIQKAIEMAKAQASK